MKLHAKLTLAIGAMLLCLAVGTGAAVASPKAKSPKYDGGPPSHAKAYGYHCKGQSKEHVKGEKGTAFSHCVKAMARADRNESLNAKAACKALSKKHVKGEKGTAFSRCVKGVNQMRKEQRRQEREEAAS